MIIVLFGEKGLDYKECFQIKEYIKDEKFFIAQLMRKGKLIKQCYIKSSFSFSYDMSILHDNDSKHVLLQTALFSLNKGMNLEKAFDGKGDEKDEEKFIIKENGKQIFIKDLEFIRKSTQIKHIIIGYWV